MIGEKMFGIVLMGVISGLVQMLAGLVADVFAGIFGLLGVAWAVPLGMAQGLEFASTIMCQSIMASLRALTCGLL